MSSPKQLGFTKKNAPFLREINIAQFGAPRSAVDKCFSRGSVNVENDWLWEELMQLSADVFKPESWHPVNPKCTAQGKERVRWAQP